MDLPLVAQAGHRCWKVVGGEVEDRCFGLRFQVSQFVREDRGLNVVATYRFEELWKI
jgi:hypothetical protein